MKTLLCNTLLATLVMAAPLHAQETCLPHEVLTKALSKEPLPAERPVFGAVMFDGRTLTIWGSLETGTWTAVVSNPDGIDCVVAVGSAWGDFPQDRHAKPDEPA